MIGETFGGKYSVIRLLGQGGMGSVYEARHQTTGRRVALKVMTSEVTKNPGHLARFERETRAAGALDSQYIAQVFDGGLDPASNAPFLVMELLSGSDLDQLERKVGPLPQELAVRIVGQACMGLSKAHAAGIVHRDIKPGNMFLSERDEDVVLKLLDFGIAKVTAGEEDATSLTTTGSLIGTPLFMSPEQAAGEKTIDRRTDIWSLGVVLYQCLGGRTPHHDATTVGKLILKICQEPAAPIGQLAPWVSPELAEIVHRAIAIDPAARFQTMDEMLAALRPLAPGGFGIRAAMLAGVTSEEKERRAISTPPAPVPAQSSDDVVRTQFAEPGVIEKLASAEVSKDLVRTTSASSTDTRSADTTRRPPESKSSLPLVLLGALATFGLAGAAYFGFIRGGQAGDHDAAALHDGTARPIAPDTGTATGTAREGADPSRAAAPVQITPGASAETAAPTASAASSTAPPASAVSTPAPLPVASHPLQVKPVPTGKKKPNDPTSAM